MLPRVKEKFSVRSFYVKIALKLCDYRWQYLCFGEFENKLRIQNYGNIIEIGAVQIY